jgi:hypothetical protein
MGRLTQERIKTIVAAAQGGASRAELIKVASVDPSRWQRWINRAREGDQPYQFLMKEIAKVATNKGVAIDAGGVQKRSLASSVKREAPDLYKAVLAGYMSVNMAYGLLRGKRLNIPSDPEKAAKALARHFSEDDLRFIAEELNEAAGRKMAAKMPRICGTYDLEQWRQSET